MTISLDDATHRRARIRAAERGQSLSAFVKQLLQELDGPVELETSEREQRVRGRLAELRARVPAGFRASGRFSREEVHDRDLP